jgi:SAM-dependent methyltransferase
VRVERADQADPLADLGYFAAWGGRSWRGLLETALRDFTGTDLRGSRALEIGFGGGRLSCLLALLGAEVTGVELDERKLEAARREASTWDVSQNVRFLAYDGDLDALEIGRFNLVFTKSVLVVVPDLAGYLGQLKRKLELHGKAIFLENGIGSLPVRLLRPLRHRGWNHRTVTYLTEREIGMVRQIFDVQLCRRSHLPPVYLICGTHSPLRGGNP